MQNKIVFKITNCDQKRTKTQLFCYPLTCQVNNHKVGQPNIFQDIHSEILIVESMEMLKFQVKINKMFFFLYLYVKFLKLIITDN